MAPGENMKNEHSSSVPTRSDAKDVGQSKNVSSEVLVNPVVHDQIDDKVVSGIENHDTIDENFNVIDTDPQQSEFGVCKQRKRKN